MSILSILCTVDFSPQTIFICPFRILKNDKIPNTILSLKRDFFAQILFNYGRWAFQIDLTFASYRHHVDSEPVQFHPCCELRPLFFCVVEYWSYHFMDFDTYCMYIKSSTKSNTIYEPINPFVCLLFFFRFVKNIN